MCVSVRIYTDTPGFVHFTVYLKKNIYKIRKEDGSVGEEKEFSFQSSENLAEAPVIKD